MAAKRSSVIPDLATSGEQASRASRRACGTPSSSPRNADAIVRKMSKAVSDMLDNPTLRSASRTWVSKSFHPSAAVRVLSKFLPEEIERWGKVVRAAHITRSERIARSCRSCRTTGGK